MNSKIALVAGVLLCGAAAYAADPQAGAASEAGPFRADQESLKQYRCPEWFRDAKFGIWAHWGPQSVPEDGDWYARRLYLSGNPNPRLGLPHFEPGSKPDRGYTLQVERYGHPSKVGYKDIIPLWKAEKWDPEKLMDLYVRAGAKYFVSMGVHHDNFDLWDSKYQPRWNAVKTGPKRDVVGTWQEVAQKHGLKFGVSEHLGASFTWFQVNKGADLTGPYAGVPYDGNNPDYWDLYHRPTKPDDHEWLTNDPEFQQHWLNRISDLVDHYHPDLLYSDSKFPFGSVGAQLVSHFYNANQAFHHGDLTAVYTCKEDPQPTGWVRDIERGVMTGISPEPWQTDTSIGDWFYRKGEKYKSATQIIAMLADIVSKNGNLLINVVQKPDGEITPEARQILEEIAGWMTVNGEAIFGTRPWTVYGEGPSTERKPEANRFGGAKDVPTQPFTGADLRFTRKGDTLYAIALARPATATRIHSIAGKKVTAVAVLGSREKVTWKQDADGLMIEPITAWPTSQAVVFKVAFGPAKLADAADTIEGSDETTQGHADVGTIAAGAFKPSWDSLAQYQAPAWFRDAKFGIFMHWGLPSVADETRPFGTGHYARGMYNQHGMGTADHCKLINDWHVGRYGHPSKFGYKDFIPLWHAERFDADALVGFYKSIGARYIVPVAVHHDNFDIYDSTYHRWNVARMGPHRDILGEWKRATEKHGLRFGASTHLDRAPSFLAASHGSDFEGPMKGVPYDGADPQYKDFYLNGVSPGEFQHNWYQRTREIIDRYQPDLLYFDGGLPFGTYGLNLAADLYNSNAARHGGRNEAVLNLKRAPVASAYVHDIERGQSDVLRPLPWQTDTTLISGWFYHQAPLEMDSAAVVQNLADIVSKNGNLLLNVGLKPDGTIPADQRAVLEGVGRWLQVNGEAIYGTRPWTVFGEGPTKVKAGSFNEQRSGFTAADIRFTTKGQTLYAIVLGWPGEGGAVSIRALGQEHGGHVRRVELLGCAEPPAYEQTGAGLNVTFPKSKPGEYAYVLKIDGAL